MLARISPGSLIRSRLAKKRMTRRADVDCTSFIAVDLHHPLLAGIPAHLGFAKVLSANLLVSGPNAIAVAQ